MIHSVPSHTDRVCYLLSYSIAKNPCYDPFSYFKFISVLTWFIDYHHLSSCILILRSIMSQVILIVFIISHHITYWNLLIAIHSLTFCSNLIRQLKSNSISYFQVEINSVPNHHNQIHPILSCSKAKHLCYDIFSSFLFNMIHKLPSRSISNYFLAIHSVSILYNWVHHLLSNFTAYRLIVIYSTPFYPG